MKNEVKIKVERDNAIGKSYLLKNKEFLGKEGKIDFVEFKGIKIVKNKLTAFHTSQEMLIN